MMTAAAAAQQPHSMHGTKIFVRRMPALLQPKPLHVFTAARYAPFMRILSNSDIAAACTLASRNQSGPWKGCELSRKGPRFRKLNDSPCPGDDQDKAAAELWQIRITTSHIDIGRTAGIILGAG